MKITALALVLALLAPPASAIPRRQAPKAPQPGLPATRGPAELPRLDPALSQGAAIADAKALTGVPGVPAANDAAPRTPAELLDGLADPKAAEIALDARNPAAQAEGLDQLYEGPQAAGEAAGSDAVLGTPSINATAISQPPDWAAIAQQKKVLGRWRKSKKRTVVAVNSYSFQDDGVPGLSLYDMRPLAQILWAADPNVNVIFVTAAPIHKAMVEHVLRGRADKKQILKRVRFVSVNDDAKDFLSEKLLLPRNNEKLREIRSHIEGFGAPAALYPYVSGPHEWMVAQMLQIPNAVYGPHPSLRYWTTKSGGRKVFGSVIGKTRFKTKGVEIARAMGREDAYDLASVARHIDSLRKARPGLKKVAIKLNFGSGGLGNLYFDLTAWAGLSPAKKVKALDEVFKKVDRDDPRSLLDTFGGLLTKERAAVEEFILGIERATFPSVQTEILPDGSVKVWSSHEQILMDKNTYVGAVYQANPAYRLAIEDAARKVAQELAKKGLVGRLGTDFAAVPTTKNGKTTYRIYLIENNIRMLGTSHPLIAAMGLTDGTFDETGTLRRSKDGAPVHYRVIDHDVRENLIGLDVPPFLKFFERKENRNILFDRKSQTGVVFHLLPAVKISGNVGYTIIAGSEEEVMDLQARLTELLNRLELEHLIGPGAAGLRTRFTPHDLRHELEKTNGHGKTSKAFSLYLMKRPRELLRGDGGRGIIFHPEGYTVVGRTASETKELTARADRLLTRFQAEELP